MSLIKHYDKNTKQWVIDSASNAKNLELSNPSFTDNGKSVSVDDGFKKIDQRVTTLEKNLAYVYINGAKGGSGGSGTISTYTLTCDQSGKTIYTTDKTVTLTGLAITGGNTSQAFTLIIKDSNSNTLATSSIISKQSVIKVPITVSTSTTLSIQGSNSSGILTDIIYVTVNVVSLSMTNPSKNTVVFSDSSKASVQSFKIITNITPTNFHFLIDGIEKYTKVIQQTSNNYTIQVNLAQAGYLDLTEIGKIYTIAAYCDAVVDTNTITSNTISYQVTVVDPTKLTIVLSGISQDSANRTSIPLNNNLSFNYTLSYYPDSSNLFTLNAEIYDSSDTLVKTLQPVTSVSKNLQYTLAISTGDYQLGNYYIKLYAYSNTDNTVNDTKLGYFTLTETTSTFMDVARSSNLLMKFYNKSIAENTSKIWQYDNSSTYSGSNNSFITTLTLHNTTTSGVQKTGFINTNSIKAIVLDSDAYADIDQFGVLFSDKQTSLSNSGFCYSITFKVDEDAGDNDTVISLLSYDANKNINNGILITASQASVYLSGTKISTDIAKGEITTVDINTKYQETTINSIKYSYYYYIIYVNGIMSAASRVLAFKQDMSDSLSSREIQDNFPWIITNQYMYLGAKINEDNSLSNFCTCNIYDIKLYEGELTDWEIVQNFIQSSECAKLTNSGELDVTLKNELYTKNLVDLSTNKCYIYDYTAREYLTGQQLLDTILKNHLQIPYRIVVVEETSSSSSDFIDYVNKSYSFSTEDQKEAILDKKYPCAIKYYDYDKTSYNDPSITIINDGTGGISPTIGIQGTSSLTYNGKNFEINYGSIQGEDMVTFTDGKIPRLFQPVSEWLPENEHTLKADVVDSGHINNVVLGKIINGQDTTIGNTTISGVKFMNNTPPMTLSDSDYASSTVKDYVSERLKHTSDGFPVLLFINFKTLDNQSNVITKMSFQGIYNFNLGRAAYYNLGLKKMYNIDTAGQVPRVITDYTPKEWEQCYSYEISTNDNKYLDFSQDNLEIIKQMFGSPKYFYNISGESSTNYPKLFYNNDSNNYGFIQMMSRLVPKTTGQVEQYQYVPSTNTYEDLNKHYSFNTTLYTYENVEKYLDLENACKYFTISIVFGMVDSLLKNLTLRYWFISNLIKWWTAFYDMDTALKNNNVGKDVISYLAHLHYYHNTTVNGKLSPDVLRFYSGVDSNGKQLYDHGEYIDTISTDGTAINQQYANYTNRLWYLIDDAYGLSDVDKTNSTGKITIADCYAQLRNSIIKDPEDFIDTYFKAYSKQNGAIMYNYDYQLKYIDIKEFIGANVQLSDSDQSSFLHGTRIQAIRNWFIKRINFLDCVYNYTSTTTTSIINSQWNNNKVKSTAGGNGAFYVTAPSKVLFSGNGEGDVADTFWIDEQEVKSIVKIPSGEKTYTIKPNLYITELNGLNEFNWTAVENFNFPKLKVIRIGSENKPQTQLTVNSFLNSGLYSTSGNGLKNIEEVYFNYIKFTDGNKILSAELCNKLRIIDLSHSSFSGVTCGSSVNYINLQDTPITGISYSSMPNLQTLVLGDNPNLTSISIQDCEKLESLIVPPTVTQLTISNCPKLTQLDLSYNGTKQSALKLVKISGCPGLITLNISNQNCPNAIFDLQGAYNLKTFNAYRTSNIIICLPNVENTSSNPWTSLVNLNISYTTASFYYGYYTEGKQLTTEWDLTKHTNLKSINFSNVQQLATIKTSLATEITLAYAAFYNCNNLSILQGKFKVTGTGVFQNCSSLKDLKNCELSFYTNSIEKMFSNCILLNNDSFAYIIEQLNVKDSNGNYINKIDNANQAFYQCSSITTAITDSFFEGCLQYLSNMKDMFNGSSISGNITSKIFKPLTQITNMESAFSGTKLDSITTDIFNYIYTKIEYIDYIFSNCSNLTATLTSDTFFAKFSNLQNSIFPKYMFSGCTKVQMTISQSLFHSINQKILTDFYKIDSSLYSGIILNGTLPIDIFSSDQIVIDNITYYRSGIISSIISPFAECLGTINFNTSDFNKYLVYQPKLQIASYIFSNCTTGDSVIPDDTFSSNTELLSIAGFFSGINNFKFDGEFPSSNLFKNNTKLENISNLFYGCIDCNIKLLGDGFTTCNLKDVSKAFSYSGVYGIIPFHLFYMPKQTITTMANVFNQCWKLGYTKDRSFNIGTKYNAGKSITTWNDHIVVNPGTKVWYTVDNTLYTGEEKLWAIDGITVNSDSSYTSDDNAQAATYDGNYINGYNQPGFQHYAFPSDLFRYCSAECTLENALTGFTYKSQILYKSETQSDIEATIVSSDITITEPIRSGNYVVQSSYDGLLGRIPAKLFDSLTQNTKFIGVFKNTHFSPYINMDVNSGTTIQYVLGWKYPFGMLDNNVNLTDITEMFANTEIEVGVQIDTNLFEKCTKLQVISGLWKNCKFHNELDETNFLTERTEHFPFANKNNGTDIPFTACAPYLRDISQLFYVDSLSNTYGYGLVYFNNVEGWFSQHTIDTTTINYPALQNISGMFYNNTLIKSITAPIVSITNTQITQYSNYLPTNIAKANVTNASSIETALQPASWQN